MEISVYDRVRLNLLSRRDHITQWLTTSPKSKIEEKSGSVDPEPVLMKLDAIESAIEKVDSGTLGLCTVCHDYVETRLLETDYTACVCLDHFSEIEKRSLENELVLAHNVQAALLSHHETDIPGVELAAYSRPAQIVGGDYYDIIRFPSGGYGFVIGDVAGHGVSASLYMASIQTALRTLIPTCGDVDEVISKVHHLYSHNIHFDTFATLFLASFDPSDYSLNYSNAGHNPPLLVRRNGSPEGSIYWLKPTGAAIGLTTEPQVAAKTITLRSGDLLLLYTDGVTEAMNGQEPFGKERLAAISRQNLDLTAGELVSLIWRHLSDFSAGQALDDDTTILALKIKGD